MFEILSGGLLGSIFGGLFRLAPEVLKFLDKGNERKHELSMFSLRKCPFKKNLLEQVLILNKKEGHLQLLS